MAWGKYHNRKVVIDGITFDSQREGDYYCELKMLRMAGEVIDFERQVTFELQPKFKHSDFNPRSLTGATAQLRYEETHSREDWFEKIGRNYL